MTATNEQMRAALREIESRAANALQSQPENTEECGRHLNKALAGIELKAHVARWGQEGYPEQSRIAGRGACNRKYRETGKRKRTATA